MTASSFARVEGVPGPATGKGVDGMIELYEFYTEMFMPVDIRNGTITGRRKHGAFTIVHEVGKHSPLFSKHLCENLEIPNMVIHHYRPDPLNGELAEYFNHQLKHVKVINISQYKPDTCDVNSEVFRDMEKVSFKFEELTIADMEGNQYTDTWEMG